MKSKFKIGSVEYFSHPVIDFYVRTEKGINTGSFTPKLPTKESTVIFHENKWMSNPFVKFIVEKKQKNFYDISIIGIKDKDAMMIFTIKNLMTGESTIVTN